MNQIRSIIVLYLFFHSYTAFANCYDPARSAEENYATCKVAAEHGESMAQYFLGQMYRKGEGVAKDPAQAADWYRKAAEHNNRLAQYNLGWMYDTGDGFKRNLDEAVSWYTKAARSGDKYAPFNIGALYFSGRDYPRDPETALFWFEVAVANGNEKALKWRDKIAGFLSPKRLKRVRDRLTVWNAEKSDFERSLQQYPVTK